MAAKTEIQKKLEADLEKAKDKVRLLEAQVELVTYLSQFKIGHLFIELMNVTALFNPAQVMKEYDENMGNKKHRSEIHRLVYKVNDLNEKYMQQ